MEVKQWVCPTMSKAPKHLPDGQAKKYTHYKNTLFFDSTTKNRLLFLKQCTELFITNTPRSIYLDMLNYRMAQLLL